MALSTLASGHSVLLCKDEAQKEFVTGVQWLDKAFGVLCKAEITTTTPAKTVKAITQNLRLPIRQAHTHLNTALKFWDGEKARQCEETERLISSISRLKNNVSERKMKIEQLNQQLQGLNQQIKDSEQKVEQAKRALSNAQDTLNDAERELRDKRRDQALVAGIGVATLAVPGVGWIASGIVASTAVVVSLTVLEDKVKSAQSGVNCAKDNVNYSENWLQAKKREKNSLCQQLKSEEKEKQITEQRLRDQERQLQDLKMAQQRSIELSDKLIRTCHVLTNIWGKSQVLNNEASRAYSLEPLLTTMKEIVDMFTPEEQKEVKQNTFSLSQEIDFSSLTWKLKTVCDANADSSIMAILDEYC